MAQSLLLSRSLSTGSDSARSTASYSSCLLGRMPGTVQLLFPYLASKYKNLRSWIYLGGQLLTTIAALLLWLLPLSAKGALLFAVYILPSTGGTYPVLMGLQIANTAGYTKRSLASSGLYIGYCLGQYCYETHSAIHTSVPSSLFGVRP